MTYLGGNVENDWLVNEVLGVPVVVDAVPRDADTLSRLKSIIITNRTKDAAAVTEVEVREGLFDGVREEVGYRDDQI